jgi:hypothetical protein
MDRNELPLEPCHLGVPSGVCKMISEPMVCLAQTMHLALSDTNYLKTDRKEIPHDLCHLGVPSDASKMIFEPMIR